MRVGQPLRAGVVEVGQGTLLEGFSCFLIARDQVNILTYSPDPRMKRAVRVFSEVLARTSYAE